MEADQDQGDEPVNPKTPRQAEARRILQEYIDDLRELIRKLRGKPHEDVSFNYHS